MTKIKLFSKQKETVDTIEERLKFSDQHSIYLSGELGVGKTYMGVSLIQRFMNDENINYTPFVVVPSIVMKKWKELLKPLGEVVTLNRSGSKKHEFKADGKIYIISVDHLNNKVKIEIDYMENDLIHVLIYEYMLSRLNHSTDSIVHLFSEHDDFTRRFDFYSGEYFKTFSENYFKPMRYRLNLHEDLGKYGFDKSYTISKFKEYGMNFDVSTSEKVDLELLDEINELYTDDNTRFEIMRNSDVLLFTNFMTFVYPNGVYNFDDFLSYKHLVQAHENIISKCFTYSDDYYKTRDAMMYLFNCDDLTHFKENLMITRNNRQHGAFGLGMLNFRLKLSSDGFDKSTKQRLLLGTHSIKEYLESL